MDGVKALAVLASIYYPGDGIVAKNNYQTSSGERYDQNAAKCAALQWPLGTMLHLVHGRNNIDVTINDHGPYRRGRALDCTPAVDKALHLGGLGSVRVEPYPPLPKARSVEAQVATWSGTDPMDVTVKPPAGYDSDRSLPPLLSNDGPQQSKRMVGLTRANSEPKKTGPSLARRPLTQHNPPALQPFRQVTLY
jgi:rare lipoprotein A